MQASLNENVGNYGDFALYSYRKFLPQPDGAVLASDYPINCDLAEPNEMFISEKLVAKVIREYGGKAEIFLRLLSEAEEHIENIICPHKMSWLSEFLFNRTDLTEIAMKRRNNWTYLGELLKDADLVGNYFDILFKSLEEGEVPLGLPIKIEGKYRDDLKRFLMSHNIFCPVHWLIQNNDNKSRCKKDFKLSESILTLPIDQRLNKTALDFFGEKLTQFFKK